MGNNKQLIENINGSFVVGPGDQEVSLMTVTASAATGSSTAKNTQPRIKDEDSAVKYAKWFSDDDDGFVKNTEEKIAGDPELGSFLGKYCELLYGGGIVYGRWNRDDAKNPKFERLFDEEIECWLEDVNIMAYMERALWDLKTFGITFPEMKKGMGTDKGKIISLDAKELPFCRRGKHNSKGVSDKVYVSSDFGDTTNEVKPFTSINPQWRPYQQVQELKDDVFYYPLVRAGLFRGNVYYPKPKWTGLLDSKMLDNAALLIKYEHYWLTNGMAVKYHVEVDERYFSAKYKDWEKKTQKEKVEIFTNEKSKFEAVLAGIEQSGKTIMTVLGVDSRLQQYSTWKITPIKQELPSDKHTEKLNQHTLAKLRAIGLNSALVGGIGNNSGSMGSGSGSAERVAVNNFVISNKHLQDLSLQPLNVVVARVNGWRKKYQGFHFMTQNYLLATEAAKSANDRI